MERLELQWLLVHPILATFIGDYPKQALIACTSNGRCPKCVVLQDKIGSSSKFPLRDHADTIHAFSLSDHHPTVFHATCRNAGLKPTYHPFWEHLLFTNIFLSITPNMLHQLHQGNLKHMVMWLAELRCNEIDTRCSCLPPNHNMQHFHNGFTWLLRLMGQECKDIARILLGVVADLALPDGQPSTNLVRLVWALLDFIYLSQYPVHTMESLQAMDMALCRFHKNKDILVDLEV